MGGVSRGGTSRVDGHSSIATINMTSRFGFRKRRPCQIGRGQAILCNASRICVARVSGKVMRKAFPTGSRRIVLAPGSMATLKMRLKSDMALRAPTKSQAFAVSNFNASSRDCCGGRACLVNSCLARDTFASIVTRGKMAGGRLACCIRFRDTTGTTGTVARLRARCRLSSKDVSRGANIVNVTKRDGGATVRDVCKLTTVLFILILLTKVLVVSNDVGDVVTRQARFFKVLHYVNTDHRRVVHFIHLRTLG